MIGAKTTVKKTPRLADGVSTAFWTGLFHAADAGFETSYNKAPIGATSGLRHSAVQPFREGDAIVWGFTSPYGADVERGTPPHHVPIEPLKLWARRVLGDEGAAYAVQHGIRQRGTKAQPFVEPGVRAMVRDLQSSGLKQHVSVERRRR